MDREAQTGQDQDQQRGINDSVLDGRFHALAQLIGHRHHQQRHHQQLQRCDREGQPGVVGIGPEPRDPVGNHQRAHAAHQRQRAAFDTDAVLPPPAPHAHAIERQPGQQGRHFQRAKPVRDEVAQPGGGQRRADHDQQAGDDQAPVRPFFVEQEPDRQQRQHEQQQAKLPPAALGLGEPVTRREHQRRMPQQQVADIPHAADRGAPQSDPHHQPEAIPHAGPIAPRPQPGHNQRQPDAPHQRPGGGLGPHPPGQHQARRRAITPAHRIVRLRPPRQQEQERRQGKEEGQRHFQIAEARPVRMGREKGPQRQHDHPHPAAEQARPQQVGRCDAAHAQQRHDGACGVIVDPTPHHLTKRVGQRQKLGIVGHVGGNLPGKSEDTPVVAVNPQRVIGREGPVGHADHAQHQRHQQPDQDQPLPAGERHTFPSGRGGGARRPPPGQQRPRCRQRQPDHQNAPRRDRGEGPQAKHTRREQHHAQREAQRQDQDAVAPVRAGQQHERPRQANPPETPQHHRQQRQRWEEPICKHRCHPPCKRRNYTAWVGRGQLGNSFQRSAFRRQSSAKTSGRRLLAGWQLA